MEMIATYLTDIGGKKTNQDSILYLTGQSPLYGTVTLAAIFDGMGGLQYGEIASAQLAFRFRNWFQNDLPKLLCPGFAFEQVRDSWNSLLRYVNEEIAAYGRDNGGFHLGSTSTTMLLLGGAYLVAHVGDCRLYEIQNSVRQITVDQTMVQREVERGHMTPEQAEHHPQRNVLLQCVGASPVVEPVYYSGTIAANTTFLLCCDGFRHEITTAELMQNFSPVELNTEAVMQERCRRTVDLVKARGEKDNISLIVVKVR